jgi:hypothetical protein
MHEIALAIARSVNAGSAKPRDPSGETSPRYYLFDEAFHPVWDDSILDTSVQSKAPAWWQLAREVLRRQADCDAVVTWGEKLSLAMLLQQQFVRAAKPHIAMMYQFEKLNVRVPLQALRRSLHAVVTWSSVQRRALIERVRYPSGRVYLIRHYVDHLFYSPRQVEEDMICAVGAEMRDYTTLMQAVTGAGIRCHIATDHVRIPGRLRLLNDRRVSIEDIVGQKDEHITRSRMSLVELRNLYARSRFVVVPLVPSDTDNGVTCILEAMAMGKPVICSRTRGQVDVIEEGVTGLYVPVGDPGALRKAILSLWNDPQRAQHMGSNARAFVEKYHTLERFTATVRSAAEASLEGRLAPDTWWE